MELFYFIGAVIFLLVYKYDREVLRFNFTEYKHYTTIILIGSLFAIASRYILGVFPPAPHLDYGRLFLVPWEDLVFSVALIYYPRKYLNPKISTIIGIITSVLFGLGHVYQGYLWAFVTCFYPFYFSYRYGKKEGYGTVIALHVTYDVCVHTVFVILAQLEFLRG